MTQSIASVAAITKSFPIHFRLKTALVLNKNINKTRVEFSSGVFFKRPSRLVLRYSCAVRPRVPQRVVCIGKCKDAGRQRYVRASQTIGVSCTVPVFVMKLDG